MGDNSPRCDNGAFAYCHPRQNYSLRPNPYVILNCYGFEDNLLLPNWPIQQVISMVCTNEDCMWANNDIIAYRYGAIIIGQYQGSRIYETPIPNREITRSRYSDIHCNKYMSPDMFSRQS